MNKVFIQFINRALLVSASLVFGVGSVMAAENSEPQVGPDGQPIEPPKPKFLKAPVMHTNWTRDCKPMGLDKAPEGSQQRRASALQPANFRRLERAQEAMQNELWDDALVVLNDLATRAASRPYDLAKTNEYIGYVHLSKGDYETAIGFFEKAINAKVLPEQSEQSLIRNVAGLYLAIEPPQPEKALQIIRTWFKTAVNPKPKDYELLGQAAVMGKLYKESICPMRMAINLAEEPKKSWYDILVAAHYELKNFEGAAIVAKERLISFPKEDKYWNQLSGLYQKLEREQDALVLLELAYKQGMLKKGSEYRNLASMYAMQEIPYKAAAVLEDGLKKGIVKATEKHWKQTGGSWQLARESKKAIDAYAEAGKLAEDGLNEMRIGVLYSDREDWNKAIEYFNMALSKGGLDTNTGRTHMNLGIALFNACRVNESLESLRNATKFDNTARNARQWINYVQDASQRACRS